MADNAIIVQDFRGLNVEDQPFLIDKSECQIATNVTVKDKAVEIRGGLQLFSSDGTRTGGITMIQPYYLFDGTSQLIFSNDDDYFYVTNAAPNTWNTIGSMGTATETPTAFQYKNQIIFGTGLIGNATKKWDGAVFSNVTTPPSAAADVRFFEFFQGQGISFLCAAGLPLNNATNNITTLYFTTNIDDWGTAPAGNRQIGPGDGQDITGLKAQDQLVTYKELSKYYQNSFYEDFTGVFTLKDYGQDRSSGGSNHESLVPIDGDIVTLAGKNRSIEGYGREGTAAGNARPKQYASNINPILNALTWQKPIIKKAKALEYNRLGIYSAPYNGNTTNNIALVGHWDIPTRNLQPSWTTWNFRIGSMSIWRDIFGEQQLMVGDALQPRIYQYDPDIYSDNGFGYTRIWRSKKFTLGSRVDWNDIVYVIIAGSMRTITEFTMKVIVNGKEQQYIIDVDQLVDNGATSSGYIGDRIIGDEVIGGNPSPSDKFRFLAVAQIPNFERYCQEVEIEIRNDQPGQYWKLDYLSINEGINLDGIPDNHKNLRSI